MSTIARNALRALILTVIITAAAAGPATAQEIAISDQDIDVIWDDLDLIRGGATTQCDVTLLGTFHENVIPKIANSLIGHITHARVQNCNVGASATFLTETLPWHLTYARFSGSLPAISSITLQISGVALRIDPADLPDCLFRTETGEPFVAIAAVNGSGQITGLQADTTAPIDLEDEDFLCAIAGDAEFSGTGIVRDLNGDLIFVALV